MRFILAKKAVCANVFVWCGVFAREREGRWGAPTGGGERYRAQATGARGEHGGHRPGLHPEHRQAARQRGGASREVGSPHGRWRGVTAPKRRGTRGWRRGNVTAAICADGGYRPGLHPEPRQAARYGNAPYCHAARQRRTRGAHEGRGSGGGRALLMEPHNRSAGGEIGVFSVVTKGIRPEYVFSSHRRSTSSVSGLRPLTISPVSHSVLFPSMPGWDIFRVLPLWRQRAG